jgi:hypothetical protein
MEDGKHDDMSETLLLPRGSTWPTVPAVIWCIKSDRKNC